MTRDIGAVTNPRLVLEHLQPVDHGHPELRTRLLRQHARRTNQVHAQLTLPLGPLDSAAAAKLIRKLDAEKRTKTPLAAAIAAVADDLASVEGSRTVVLVTDGAETCKGDPEAEIIALREAGIDVNLNIVGFALDDDDVKAEMAAWAEAGGGVFLDAADAKGLTRTIRAALQAPYQVFGEDGELVATGTVGSTGVQLDPGLYRVEVLTDPPAVFDRVELASADEVRLSLAAPPA